MVQQLKKSCLTSKILPFHEKLGKPLTKQKISVLQINLGKRCNLACIHCHVEASPRRTEELSPKICQQIIQLIHQFPQIQVVDITGGAPEMLYGFKPIIEAARATGKKVIVRSSLTIYFEQGYEEIPEYCAKNQVNIVASLPCYLEDNVDQMRGNGVYEASIRALQKLNDLGYAYDPQLQLDLVYNPPILSTENFSTENFSLTPNQVKLEQAYRYFLKTQFDINFNHLLTITNLPIGRTKTHLRRHSLDQAYLSFLETNFNKSTVQNLMCRNELSIDYLGNIYDCDFNQMENLTAKSKYEEFLTVAKLLEMGSLDLIEKVQTDSHCYGCTAGSGSSCGGALI